MAVDKHALDHNRLLYRYAEAAQLLGFSEQALRDLVYKHRGPPRFQNGRVVRFAHSDLLEWIARNREIPQPVTPTDNATSKKGRGRPSVAYRQSRLPTQSRRIDERDNRLSNDGRAG